MSLEVRERIIKHLSHTLNATRHELKGLVRISKDGEFDALMAQFIQSTPQLRVREAGTDREWYYLKAATPLDKGLEIRKQGRSRSAVNATLGLR